MNHLNLGGGGYGEPRLHHSTPTWATRLKLHLKNKQTRAGKASEEGMIKLTYSGRESAGFVMSEGKSDLGGKGNMWKGPEVAMNPWWAGRGASHL